MVALARQDFGLSQSWDKFGGSVAGDAISPTDHELSLIRHSLVESFDSLFGQDIEWADMSTRAAGGASSAGAAAESTGAVPGVSESGHSSVAVLAVGLALAALWSEGDDAGRAKQSAEPSTAPLRRRHVSP